MAGICRENSNPPPSFPRKWESRNAKLQEFIGNDRNSTNLDSRFRGNDGGLGFLFLNFCFCENGKIFGSCMDNEILDGGNLSGKQQSLPSFPRKWESRNSKLQEFIGNDRNSTNLDSRFRGNAEGLGFLFLNFCFCENGKIFGSCMDNEILDGGNLSGKQQPSVVIPTKVGI
ncbi:Uncharacterised protein [Neisseria meningitidis]|nr:Uncharacterised protein [Neisseria meningitidis]